MKTGVTVGCLLGEAVGRIVWKETEQSAQILCAELEMVHSAAFGFVLCGTG